MALAMTEEIQLLRQEHSPDCHPDLLRIKHTCHAMSTLQTIDRRQRFKILPVSRGHQLFTK